jgi:hypothetical protein
MNLSIVLCKRKLTKKKKKQTLLVIQCGENHNFEPRLEIYKCLIEGTMTSTGKEELIDIPF